MVGEETPTQWLARLLKRQATTKPGDAKESGLHDIFPSTHCHTLFLPAVSPAALRALHKLRPEELTPAYQQDMRSLTTHLRAALHAARPALAAAAEAPAEAAAAPAQALAAPAADVRAQEDKAQTL